MLRIAFAISALVLLAGQAGAASYSAKPLTAASGRLIARDIVWNCGPAACQGSTQESRPVVICQSLARRAGQIESFIVDGRAFTASELDRCNASAKSDASKALAAQ